jgi:hypothetical protein
MLSPRAHRRNLLLGLSRISAFRLPASRSWTQYSRVLTLLTCGIGLVCANTFAQTADASRWANVSAWKGTVSVSGSGSGSYNDASCTNEFTNTQWLNSSPQAWPVSSG